MSSVLLSSSLQAAQVTEQEIKAELVVRFLGYFDWQSEENFRSFHIAFLGSDAEFLSALTAATTDRVIQGKTIQLFSADYAEDLSKYQALIVAASANTRFADITRKARNTNTLVISDGVQDPTNIMINFSLSTKSTVTFEINKANILLEQLKMSNDILLLGGTELDVAEIYRTMEENLFAITNEHNLIENELIQEKSELSGIKISLLDSQKNLAKSQQMLRVLDRNADEQSAVISRQNAAIALARSDLDQLGISHQLNRNLLHEHRQQLEQRQVELIQQQEKMTVNRTMLDSQNQELKVQRRNLSLLSTRNQNCYLRWSR